MATLHVTALTHGGNGLAESVAQELDTTLEDSGYLAAATRTTSLQFEYDLALLAPGKKALQTAELLMGSRWGERTHLVVPELGFGEETDPTTHSLFQLVRAVGHAPLQEYLQSDRIELAVSHGAIAWKVTRERLNHFINGVEGRVVIVGNPVLLPAMGWVAARGYGSFRSELVQARLSPVSGFQFAFENGSFVSGLLIY